MESQIHETAVIAHSASIGQGVQIAPYAIIGEDVVIGDKCIIEPFVHLKSGTRLGRNNHIHSNAVLGGEPQHLQYAGEKTETIIGNNNIIREFVTIHRGTVQGHGKTSVGNNCLIMAYAHVAHDCIIADNVIMANAVQLAGHCEVGKNTIISGQAACQQFLRIGEYAFLGGSSGYNLDIPPYMLAHGVRGRLVGVNRIGLKRNGFTDATTKALSRSYKTIFRSGLARELALKQCAEEFPDFPEVANLIEFIRNSQNGVASDKGKKKADDD